MKFYGMHIQEYDEPHNYKVAWIGGILPALLTLVVVVYTQNRKLFGYIGVA